MAKIFDRGSTWELVIFPEITEAVEIIDEPAKGYRATLGYNPSTDLHVVANVTYDKNMYSIEDVLKKVEALRTCERCETLDRERLKLESIEIPSAPIAVRETYPPIQAPLPVPTEAPLPQSTVPKAPLSQQVTPDIKNMFATVVMDAYLTDPGKYFLGLMLDDQTLMESAYPADKQDMGHFMGDMIDFMSGEMDFMRSPEEAREFLTVMRTEEEDRKPGVRAKTKKRLPSATDSIVIF